MGWCDFSSLWSFFSCFCEDSLWWDRCCNNAVSSYHTLTNALAFKSGSPTSLCRSVYLACTTLAIFRACVPFLLSHNGVTLVCPPMWLAASVFFVTKNAGKKKAFMKTLNKKIAYQHTNHSQLLNWTKIEGFSQFSPGFSRWESALLVRYKESALRASSFVNDTSLSQTQSTNTSAFNIEREWGKMKLQII